MNICKLVGIFGVNIKVGNNIHAHCISLRNSEDSCDEKKLSHIVVKYKLEAIDIGIDHLEPYGASLRKLINFKMISTLRDVIIVNFRLLVISDNTL